MRLDARLTQTALHVFLPLHLCASAASGAEVRPPITLAAIAGTYHATDPAGGYCRLEIGNDGHYDETCFQGPAMSRQRGRVALGNTRFALVADGSRIRFTSPEDLDSLGGGGYPGDTRKGFPASVWRQVAWGDRSYLITRSQIREFCIAVAEGTEPRQHRVGSFYLREGDDTKLVRAPSPVTECEGRTPTRP
jgi:hypothetical protein